MPIKSGFIFAALLLLSFFIPSHAYAVCNIPANPTCWTGDSRCASGQEACNGTNESGESCVACRSTGVTQRLTCSNPTLQGGTCNNVCDEPGATSDCYTKVSCDAGVTCSGISGNGCNYCVAPVCNQNGIQDNGEAGVDCGGGGCSACPTPTPTPIPIPTPTPTLTPTPIPGVQSCSSGGSSGFCGNLTQQFPGGQQVSCPSGTLVRGTSGDSSCTNPQFNQCWVCQGPTPTPTPIGCVSCGTNGQCGGNPPTFPANCLSCSGSWVYQSAGDATCSSSAQGTQYPYCWTCSAPLPTATPVPPGVPTPTPTP